MNNNEGIIEFADHNRPITNVSLFVPNRFYDEQGRLIYTLNNAGDFSLGVKVLDKEKKHEVENFLVQVDVSALKKVEDALLDKKDIEDMEERLDPVRFYLRVFGAINECLVEVIETEYVQMPDDVNKKYYVSVIPLINRLKITTDGISFINPEDLCKDTTKTNLSLN